MPKRKRKYNRKKSSKKTKEINELNPKRKRLTEKSYKKIMVKVRRDKFPEVVEFLNRIPHVESRNSYLIKLIQYDIKYNVVKMFDEIEEGDRDGL